jgi:hemoglobin
MYVRILLFVSFASLGLSACGGKQPAPAAPADKSLYDRLGGMDAIKAVVKDFVEEQVAKDTRINHFFANSDLAKLQGHLADQICEAAGGPCKYTGRNMRESHAGMGVSAEDFSALVDDLQKSLAKFDVGAQEQQELLGALAPMHDDIVETKAQ